MVTGGTAQHGSRIEIEISNNHARGHSLLKFTVLPAFLFATVVCTVLGAEGSACTSEETLTVTSSDQWKEQLLQMVLTQECHDCVRDAADDPAMLKACWPPIRSDRCRSKNRPTTPYISSV